MTVAARAALQVGLALAVLASCVLNVRCIDSWQPSDPPPVTLALMLFSYDAPHEDISIEVERMVQVVSQTEGMDVVIVTALPTPWHSRSADMDLSTLSSVYHVRHNMQVSSNAFGTRWASFDYFPLFRIVKPKFILAMDMGSSCLEVGCLRKMVKAAKKAIKEDPANKLSVWQPLLLDECDGARTPRRMYDPIQWSATAEEIQTAIDGEVHGIQRGAIVVDVNEATEAQENIKAARNWLKQREELHYLDGSVMLMTIDGFERFGQQIFESQNTGGMSSFHAAWAIGALGGKVIPMPEAVFRRRSCTFSLTDIAWPFTEILHVRDAQADNFQELWGVDMDVPPASYESLIGPEKLKKLKGKNYDLATRNMPSSFVPPHKMTALPHSNTILATLMFGGVTSFKIVADGHSKDAYGREAINQIGQHYRYVYENKASAEELGEVEIGIQIGPPPPALNISIPPHLLQFQQQFQEYVRSALPQSDEPIAWDEREEGVPLLRSTVVFRTSSVEAVPNHLEAPMMVVRVLGDDNELEFLYFFVVEHEEGKQDEEIVRAIDSSNEHGVELVKTGFTLPLPRYISDTRTMVTQWRYRVTRLP